MFYMLCVFCDSVISFVYLPYLNKKEWSCHAARRGGQSSVPHTASHFWKYDKYFKMLSGLLYAVLLIM